MTHMNLMLNLLRVLWAFRPRRATALLFTLGFWMAFHPSFAQAGGITAIWANTGEDKVTRDELRSTRGTNVRNSVWDGSKISIFGGRNEVVAFNVILEAGSSGASNVRVSFPQLSEPSGSTIASSAATGNGVFGWVGRNIELFYVRYLQVKGISLVSYPTDVDERQIPQRFQRPWTGNGVPSGGWTNRPDHDKFYPEIAVPLELVPAFNITGGQNQSIWVDVYIPKSAAPGLYQGTVVVQENGVLLQSIPVQLKVYNFTLPDTPNSKTMVDFGSANINQRFLGSSWVNPTSAAGAKASLLRDRYVMLAHRHRISLIGDNSLDDCNSTADQPCPDWVPRLNGSLFTPSHGYDGPGVGVGNNVYSIGTYSSWSWRNGTQADMHQHTNNWANWFSQNAPETEYFLYLLDESPDYPQTQTWAQWILNNPGPGRQVKSLATLNLTDAASHTSALDIPTTTLWEGVPSRWQPLADSYTTDARKRFYMYNGHRPASGSFATEDDGIALRELAWGQYKKRVNRWFFWEGTYYNNNQGGMGQTNLFQTAQTFGGRGSMNSSMGETGWNYSNGDGVLLYPGTDTVFPADSYGVDGPFASLRLKHWRRGIQDVDYLTMAAAVSPTTTQNIVNQIVPKVLWEYGVDNPSDPTYVHTPISWSNNPDVWETARAQLANILAPSSAPPTPMTVTVSPSTATLSMGATYQFTAVLMDQARQVMPSPFLWTVSGGSVSVNGLYKAAMGAGIYTVTAQAGNLRGSASVTVSSPSVTVIDKIPPPSTLSFNYPNTTTLRLYWSASTGSVTASGYRLDVATDPGFANPVAGYLNRDMGNTLSANVAGLASGTIHYARVRAYDVAGNISDNTLVAAMATLNADFAVLSTPVRVVLKNPTSTSLSLSWAPSTSTGSLKASTYQVQVSSSPAFSDFTNNPWGGYFYPYPATSMSLDGLVAGIRTYARVRAIDAYGNASRYGSPVLVGVPSSISFNYPNTTTLRLYWGASTGSVTTAGYLLDVATDPGFANFVPGYLKRDMSNTLSVNLSALTPGTTHYARVRAYDAAWNVSDNTPVAAMATLNANFAALSTPVKVVVGNPTPTSLSLSWGYAASTGSLKVATYQVQVSTSPTFSNFANDAWGGYFYAYPATTMSLDGLIPGIRYYARVRALDAYGNASLYGTPPLTSAAFLTAVDAVRVYPNPWRRDRHQGSPITFDQLRPNSQVKIFTVAGHWVETLDATSGTAQWYLTTNGGDSAASGLYMYLTTNGQEKTGQGKVAVIR